VSVGRLDTLIWALIYGGLVVLTVGLALHRTAPAFALGVIVLGTLLAVAGVLLIVVRSRTVGRRR